jgi:hypothetical protein
MIHALLASHSLNLIEVYLLVAFITFFGLTFLGIWFNGKTSQQDKFSSILGASLILALMWFIGFFFLTYGYLSEHLKWVN